MCGWPAKMMVHIGGVETGELMSQILDLLRPGDVLTHCLFRSAEHRRRLHQHRAGRQAAAGRARRQAARRDLRCRPWRRQLRLHRRRGRHSRAAARRTRSPPTSTCSPATRRACRILPNVMSKFIADGLHAGAGGDHGDHGAGQDHQPCAEDRHPADRRARRRRDHGSGRGPGDVRRHPQQQARRQAVAEAGADRDQRRAVRPAVSVAVFGAGRLGGRCSGRP